MHTDKLESVSSKAVGLTALGRRREKHRYGGWLLQREIPLTSHQYQQTAAANKHFAGRFLPAAGNRWDDELNNAGSNGNYWSSTLNESNPNNAYNLNFNSGGANWNNNNRNNGHSVRPVR